MVVRGRGCVHHVRGVDMCVLIYTSRECGVYDTDAHTHAHTFMHTCTHTDMHACIHTYIQRERERERDACIHIPLVGH